MLDDTRPGRSCPVHYRYSPSVFRRAADLRADALYVAGGLYGNTPALARLLEMYAAEEGDARLVFNGDFNWFNADPESFARINETVLQHAATRGNVETELAAEDGAYGCGCGYPEWVSDGVVERSNRIMERLCRTARPFPELRQRLGALPMHLVAQVGGVRVAIVHGDAESLAGWAFSHEALTSGNNYREVKRWFETAAVPVFAATHTCLPVVAELGLSDGAGAVVNNGAAGMPNFEGTQYGVVTRIATRPTTHASRFGFRLRGLYIDLLKVEYDQAQWLEIFQRNWPPESPAYASYFERIARGPEFQGPVQVCLAGDAP